MRSTVTKKSLKKGPKLTRKRPKNDRHSLKVPLLEPLSNRSYFTNFMEGILIAIALLYAIIIIMTATAVGVIAW